MVDREKALELRREGLSYIEIAVALDCTIYDIHIAVGHVAGGAFLRAFTPERCVYSGIREWLNNNKMSLRQLCEHMDTIVTGATLNRVRDMLRGTRELRKSDIDRLMEITGLTYEQAFLEGKK